VNVVTDAELRQRDFVDRMGILMVRAGAPNMLGRILGHLLVCDPPEQSLTQLVEALGISKGAASQTSRQLEQLGMIERVPGAGRSSWYRARVGAWSEVLREQVLLIRLFVELAESGLQLPGKAGESGERLRDLRAFYVDMEAELLRYADAYAASHPKTSRRR
jgi:hypothetical protein